MRTGRFCQGAGQKGARQLGRNACQGSFLLFPPNRLVLLLVLAYSLRAVMRLFPKHATALQMCSPHPCIMA